jgi:hypothetical protein
MSTHITINTLANGEMAWPLTRVHLRHLTPIEGPTGRPESWEVLDPEMRIWKISEDEYNRLQGVLTKKPDLRQELVLNNYLPRLKDLGFNTAYAFLSDGWCHELCNFISSLKHKAEEISNEGIPDRV